jgi:hypothetical protein
MPLDQGIITEKACENILPPPDTRCADAFFALENPDLCPAQPKLVIKPGFVLDCQLGSVQFKAFKVTSGVEVDVTNQTTFSSSDPLTAVIGVASGNATGLIPGTVTISGSYQGMTAHAEMVILAGKDCCQEQKVAIMVLVDVTKSMSLGFSADYAKRIDFAKAAAKRFISEIDGTKDLVGLMTFTDAAQTVLSAPIADTNAVAALVDGISQTQDKTSFHAAFVQAISELNSVAADRRLLYIISDGEETAQTDNQDNNPFTVLDDFKQSGGIVMCMGVRASAVQNGFYTLSLFSTGGFFVNAYPGTDAAALNYISGLKGYVCAGNCTPAGDVIVNQGKLNYTGFINWNVIGGNVDLIGNGFLDLLPGNGLYVDLGGSTPPYNGRLESKVAIHLTSGHVYRLTVSLAGNQQNDPNDLVALVKVISGTQELISQSVSITGANQGLQPYSFSFTAPSDIDVKISIQQALAPGFSSVADPRWGLLLNDVLFEDVTNAVRVFEDNFDNENPVYIPPACGTGTTYVWIPSIMAYGYMVGTECYNGYGCLTSPPSIQVPDPNPLSDVESGIAPPPQQWTSTKEACASCPPGSKQASGSTTQICKTATATSDISQSDADAKAYAAALALANAALNCQATYTSTQQYTATCSGGCANSSPGSFGSDVTKTATATSNISQADADAQALAAAQAAACAALDCTGSNNGQGIIINDSANPPTAATPFPSVQHVSGMTGTITHVLVVLGALSHTWPTDIHMMLMGPDGTTCELMRNCGDHIALVSVPLINFDDGGIPMPPNSLIGPGIYKPSQYGVPANFPAPAPVGPYGTTLSVFIGKNPNGSWSLWVADDASANSGQIAGGWTINIMTA